MVSGVSLNDIADLLGRAGFRTTWDSGAGRLRLRIEAENSGQAGQAPLRAVLSGDTGQGGYWRRGNSVLSFQGQALSPQQQRAMKRLIDLLETPLAQPLDWNAISALAEDDLGFVQLRPVGGEGAGREWILMIPSPGEQTCVFCNRSFGFRLKQEQALRQAPDQVVYLERWFVAHAVAPGERFMVGGNEPLTMPGLEALLETVRRFGGEPFRLQTAGWPVTAERAEGLRALGVREVDIPFYSHRAETHDELVAFDGAFDRAVVGVKTFLEAGLRVSSHMVLVPQNVPHAAATVAFVQALGVDQFSLLYPTEVPVADWQKRRLTPSLGAVRQALCELAQVVLPEGFLKLGLPPCTLAGGWRNAFLPPEPNQERVFAPACQGCAARQECTGLGASYGALHGQGDIQPLAVW